MSKFTRSAVSNGTRLHQILPTDLRSGARLAASRTCVWLCATEVGGFDALGEGDRWAAGAQRPSLASESEPAGAMARGQEVDHDLSSG